MSSPDESAIYRDVAARLVATGRFDHVNYDGVFVGSDPASTPHRCFAHLRPGTATNPADFLPSTRLRKVEYTLEIVRTPGADMADLDWYRGLASAAADALSGVSLAGITAPGLTRLSGDTLARDGGEAVRVASTIVLDGTFTYPIPS